MYFIAFFYILSIFYLVVLNNKISFENDLNLQIPPTSWFDILRIFPNPKKQKN
jgi:hypothetical protein